MDAGGQTSAAVAAEPDSMVAAVQAASLGTPQHANDDSRQATRASNSNSAVSSTALAAARALVTPMDAAEAHLWSAIERGDARRVHELATRWPSLVRAQHIGRHLASPVHLAAAGGHLDVLRVLASAGANLSAVDAMQASPLHYAAEHGRVAAIEWLLRRESNVAVVDVLGCTPLHVAARAGHVDCARTLAGVVGVDGLLFPSAPPPARNPKTLNFKIY